MKLIDDLYDRKNQLEQIVQLANEKINSLPENTFFTGLANGAVRYYEKCVENGKNIYLGKDKMQRIKELEESEYYKRVLKEAEKQQIVIDKAIKALEKTSDPETVFLALPKNRRHLIEPLVLEKDRFKNFFGKTMPHAAVVDSSTYITLAGEKVRSKSELIIADRLFNADVPYYYEANAVFGYMMQVNPDFTVVNKRTGKVYYWEHFGMMDDIKYCQNSQIKLENYAKNGCIPGKNLITTYESSARPLSTEYIDTIIRELLL